MRAETTSVAGNAPAARHGAQQAPQGLHLRERLVQMPFVLPLITFAALLALWEAGTWLFAVPSYILPAPSHILGGFAALDMSRWVTHVWATLRVALLGYTAAILISLPIAISLSRSPLASRALYPLLVVIQSVPIVAVAPIIIVVLGTGDAPRVVITFMISFFPLVVSMTTGLMATPPELIELSRSLRAPRRREILQIRMPYATPHIFSGLKISITLAVIGAVVGEFVAAERGLGFFIQFSTSMFRLPQAWAGLVVLVAMSLLLFQAVSLIQRLFFPWSLAKADR